MKMNRPRVLLEKILSSSMVEDPGGKMIKLSANVDDKEGEFLSKLVKEQIPRRSLEVGFANGIATLYICSELQNQEIRDHIVIDPNQSTEWKNVGVANLERAGIDFCRVLEKPSEIALPQLLEEGKKIDFAFIDGWHTFDHALMDFFYIDKMLNINGLVVIDDVSYPSLNKLMRYIFSNFSNYEYVGHVPQHGNGQSVKGSPIRRAAKSLVRSATKILPSKLRPRLVSPKIIETDQQLHLDATMIAIRKTAEDKRSWYFYNDF
jgi:predicted O-methyltransferase YrrM